ncbi:AzlD domain-containing protein [Halorussus salilacus]|uniref:AzlD domain-containing protein n=1 Tax=Halorussus salilacus TaxID=2953750 RepID=UPI0020A019AE|nr:AzlD domain-containing protein [Halorussus salilacus]USZ69264.1 AzlD domain-containing protein [Halorussus salilacus]
MAGTDYGSLALWAVILAAGVGTFAFRFSFIALFGRLDDVPEGVERALRFVPAAVLAALVAPDLVYADGAVAFTPANPRLLAGAVAAAVAWRTEDIAATLVAGMATLWMLAFAVP